MRALATFFFLAASLIVVARAEPAPYLKKLCDLLCGGVWREEGATNPVEERYLWDGTANVLRAVLHREGEADTLWLAGWDSQSKKIWLVQTVGGDLPSVGGITLTEKGFFFSIALVDGKGSYASKIIFSGKDEYSGSFMGTTPEGAEGSGQLGTYKRTPE